MGDVTYDTPIAAMEDPPRTTLMTLPLEIRLSIWRLSICPQAEADCCDQAVPNSARRLLRNPWYPTSTLPTFKYPEPRIPLRLVNRQANHEIKSYIALPPLTARVCDYYICLRRALDVLSHRTSTASEIDLAHIAAFKVTSERINVLRPLESATGFECGNDPRVERVAQAFINELKGYYRHVRLAHASYDDDDNDDDNANDNNNPRSSTVHNVTMLYEVAKPILTVVCGDGGMVVVAVDQQDF